MNWSIQPITNKASEIRHNPLMNTEGTINKIEMAIIGIPIWCVSLFKGCVWLSEYSSIHSSHVRPPIIFFTSETDPAAGRCGNPPKILAAKPFHNQAIGQDGAVSLNESIQEICWHKGIRIWNSHGDLRYDPLIHY